jgi:hypothetical protein
VFSASVPFDQHGKLRVGDKIRDPFRLDDIADLAGLKRSNSLWIKLENLNAGRRNNPAHPNIRVAASVTSLRKDGRRNALFEGNRQFGVRLELHFKGWQRPRHWLRLVTRTGLAYRWHAEQQNQGNASQHKSVRGLAGTMIAEDSTRRSIFGKGMVIESEIPMALTSKWAKSFPQPHCDI